ncbi:MAG: hypothetical protein IKP20_07560 [Candidatus Methanomethylophilaceae archaeon]|nr:hypothetical protein [Candidatus Methanomethylophilaceae archaeon]
MYESIESYITLQHEYTNVPDFLSCACKYFLMRYNYDVEPQINNIIREHMSKGLIVEKIRFISKYSGESISKQATIASGITANLHGLVSSYPYLDYTNVLRYSVEFYYEAIVKSRDINACRAMKKYFDKDRREDFSPPEIRIVCETRSA